MDEHKTDNVEVNNQILTFIGGNQRYSFDIINVTDIIEIPEITPIPLVSRSIVGVMNLRGKVVPVMDFNTRMGLEDFDYDDRSCVVVVEAEGSPMGIRVQRICDAKSFEKEHFSPSPVQGSVVKGYLEENGERIVLLNSTQLIIKD